MDLKEIKEGFSYELENGLDHAEWYEKEMKWLITQAEKLEKIQTFSSVDNITLVDFAKETLKIIEEIEKGIE